MMTVLGMKRMKKAIIKMAREGDTEWNDMLQTAVIAINRLIQERSK